MHFIQRPSFTDGLFYFNAIAKEKCEALALLKTFKKIELGNDLLACTKGMDKVPADLILGSTDGSHLQMSK
jgi:hypothetical protein